MPKTSPPNQTAPADGGDAPGRALAAVQVALDRRDNGGDADSARDREAARQAGRHRPPPRRGRRRRPAAPGLTSPTRASPRASPACFCG